MNVNLNLNRNMNDISLDNTSNQENNIQNYLIVKNQNGNNFFNQKEYENATLEYEEMMRIYVKIASLIFEEAQKNYDSLEFNESRIQTLFSYSSQLMEIRNLVNDVALKILYSKNLDLNLKIEKKKADFFDKKIELNNEDVDKFHQFILELAKKNQTIFYESLLFIQNLELNSNKFFSKANLFEVYMKLVNNFGNF